MRGTTLLTIVVERNIPMMKLTESKVIIEMSRGEVSLMEQDDIENVS